mmetsp:Transcript_61134/g.186615  ORF Transcript_61134/g.186615 Transcript_61134/m.186615 type:complete len:314 (+) Transcript_61134:830-1771(+)
MSEEDWAKHVRCWPKARSSSAKRRFASRVAITQLPAQSSEDDKLATIPDTEASGELAVGSAWDSPGSLDASPSSGRTGRSMASLHASTSRATCPFKARSACRSNKIERSCCTLCIHAPSSANCSAAIWTSTLRRGVWHLGWARSILKPGENPGVSSCLTSQEMFTCCVVRRPTCGATSANDVFISALPVRRRSEIRSVSTAPTPRVAKRWYLPSVFQKCSSTLVVTLLVRAATTRPPADFSTVRLSGLSTSRVSVRSWVQDVCNSKQRETAVPAPAHDASCSRCSARRPKLARQFTCDATAEFVKHSARTYLS